MFDSSQSLEEFFDELHQSSVPAIEDNSSVELSGLDVLDERYCAVDHGGYTVVYEHSCGDSQDCAYTIERIVFDNGFVL